MRGYLFLILFFVLASCKEKKGSLVKEDNDGDEIYRVTSDDDDMNEAIEKARATYNDFLVAFAKQDSTCRDFTVKMKFPYSEEDAEHMWLANMYYEKEKLMGVLNSYPMYISSVKFGDTLEIRKEQLSDWIYIKNNKLVGGYTLLALYNKMSGIEKEEFKRDLDFEIE